MGSVTYIPKPIAVELPEQQRRCVVMVGYIHGKQWQQACVVATELHAAASTTTYRRTPCGDKVIIAFFPWRLVMVDAV